MSTSARGRIYEKYNFMRFHFNKNDSSSAIKTNLVLMHRELWHRTFTNNLLHYKTCGCKFLLPSKLLSLLREEAPVNEGKGFTFWNKMAISHSKQEEVQRIAELIEFVKNIVLCANNRFPKWLQILYLPVTFPLNVFGYCGRE